MLWKNEPCSKFTRDERVSTLTRTLNEATIYQQMIFQFYLVIILVYCLCIECLVKYLGAVVRYYIYRRYVKKFGGERAND